MRSSKERKHERKRKQQRTSVEKTEASRKRRHDNKAKREAIHKQMPDAEIVMKDGIPYMDGDKLDLINGIYTLVPPVLPEEITKTERDCEAAKGKAIDAQIEKERLFGFKALANRFRKK